MNNEKPTPETYAAWSAAQELRHENGSPAYAWAAKDMYNFARKLERERDSYAAKLVASEAYEAGLLAERNEARELARELRDALEYILGDSVSHLRNTAIERAQAAVTKAKEALL